MKVLLVEVMLVVVVLVVTMLVVMMLASFSRYFALTERHSLRKEIER